MTAAGAEPSVAKPCEPGVLSSDQLEQLVAERTTKLQQALAEHERTAAALEQVSIELRRSNDELKQYAYAVSHDLLEPLRAITSYVELLEHRYRGRLDPDADEFIHYIVDGTRRMADLIQGLLAYSRAGHAHGQTTKVCCKSIVEQTMITMAPIMATAHAELTHDPLPTVVADRTRMTQLFQNLLSNAVKYRRVEVPLRIHISVRRTGRFWCFGFADNGIGIDMNFHLRVFDVFSRLHTRRHSQGTGIGLALCKRIVESLGGSIWVESVVDQGSVFYFTLPVEDCASEKSLLPGIGQ